MYTPVRPCDHANIHAILRLTRVLLSYHAIIHKIKAAPKTDVPFERPSRVAKPVWDPDIMIKCAKNTVAVYGVCEPVQSAHMVQLLELQLGYFIYCKVYCQKQQPGLLGTADAVCRHFC